MSASMAEVLEAHPGLEWNYEFVNHELGGRNSGWWQCVKCKEKVTSGSIVTHQADVLAANGYGNVGPTQFVLAEREAELLNLKGSCRAPGCRLHFAHRGPCDTRRPE